MRRVVEGRAGVVAAFILGLVVALAGTATAAKLITGKQIKDGSISRKDLAKDLQRQLAKTGAMGAPGAPGPKGDAGPPGAVGPTDGAAGHQASWNPARTPSATPDLPADAGQTVTLTTTRAGRLAVFADVADAGINCTSGQQLIGVYLDGVPVPESTDGVSIVAASRAKSLSGVTTQVVPAGDHKVSVAMDCPTGDQTGFVFGTTHATVIVLGG